MQYILKMKVILRLTRYWFIVLKANSFKRDSLVEPVINLCLLLKEMYLVMGEYSMTEFL